MIEPLFEQLGVGPAFAILAGLAAALATAGVFVRRRAARARDRWALIGAARVRARDVAPGRVAVRGAWVNLGGAGAVEEDGHVALVERGPDAPPIADGAPVLVVGWVERQADHPRGGAFRETGRAWVIEGDGADPVAVCTGEAPEARGLRAARRLALVGVALLALGVALGAGSAALCLRAAAADDYSE
jgi:hypothetical protein